MIFIIRQFIGGGIPAGIYQLSDQGVYSTENLVQFMALAFNKKVRYWSLPKFIYRLLKRNNHTQKYRIGSLDKLLGNLSIDNSKISNALGESVLPFTTEEAFKDYLK